MTSSPTLAASLLQASTCAWCGASLGAPRQRYCRKQCRQSAWRLRKRVGDPSATNATGPGLVFAYADPPYPGKAHYYRDQASFAGEVDHAQLIASLAAARLDGWALSTSREALRDVLPLCPRSAWPCPWVKPIGVPRTTYGLHNTHEYLIVVGGRRRRPGVRDWLRAMPARGGGDLIGRKPIAFAAFLFQALGMVPGDVLLDLYPGSGIVSTAWEELSSRSSATSAGHPATPRVVEIPATWPAAARASPLEAATLRRRRAASDAPSLAPRESPVSGVV